MADNSLSYCNRCESELIEVSQVVEQLTNYRAPLIVTKFKCTNAECQKEADIKLQEAINRREIQIKAKEERLQKAILKVAKV